MNNSFKAVRVLLTTTAILIVLLIGFTALNFKNISEEADPQIVDHPFVETAVAVINEPIAASGAVVFKNNCKTCHRIDAPLIGPPLREVYSRRDAEWMREWIRNSSKMIANNDPTAIEVYNQYKKTSMTNFTSMSKEDLDAVIAYLKYVGENKDSKFD
jgi:cytochrome c2